MYGYCEYLTPDEIFTNYNQVKVFEKIFGKKIIIGKYYISPFRKDNTPGAKFDWINGKLYFIDFGDSHRTHRDCINAVQDYFNLSFNDAIMYISNLDNIKLEMPDIKLSGIKKLDKSKNTIIQIYPRLFSIDDINYWNQYGISVDDLSEDSVIPIYKARINGSTVIRFNSIAYAYTDFPDGRKKLYSPKSGKKYGKWISNVTRNDIGNINSLPLRGNQIIITKSYKDRRVLYNQGLDVVWFQNEGVIPDDYLLKRIARRFKKIVIFFDSDNPGIMASTKLRSYLVSKFNNEIVEINIKATNTKDPSDFVKYYGTNELRNFLKHNLLL